MSSTSTSRFQGRRRDVESLVKCIEPRILINVEFDDIAPVGSKVSIFSLDHNDIDDIDDIDEVEVTLAGTRIRRW